MAFSFHSTYEAEVEERAKAFYETLSEKDRRRYAAIEAQRLGHGGITYVARVFGCSERTIERGLAELAELPHDPAAGRVRRPGGGRKKSRLRSSTRTKPESDAGGSHCGRPR
jgi:hypothetical protein